MNQLATSRSYLEQALRDHPGRTANHGGHALESTVLVSLHRIQGDKEEAAAAAGKNFVGHQACVHSSL